jgi:hypothetical protein
MDHQKTAPYERSNEDPTPVINQPEPEKILFSWNAPSRLYKKRNRDFYTTIAALVFLISIILLLAREFLLIGVVMAFGFLSYVLASVKPEPIENTLTNKGVRTHDKLYLWPEISRYWWEEKWSTHLLHLEYPPQFPHKVILLATSEQKTDIDKVVAKYVIMDKPDPNFLDKSASWLQQKVPLEHDAGATPPPVPNPPQA